MQTITLGLLLFLTTSTFAGTLENNRTGEAIEFVMKDDYRSVKMISRATDLNSNILMLQSLEKRDVGRDFQVDLLSFNHFIDSEFYQGGSGCSRGLSNRYVTETPQREMTTGNMILTVLFPVYNAPRLAALGLDTLFLPLKAPARLIKSMQLSRDFNLLQKAIFKNEVVTVSQRRFKRIIDLLKYSETRDSLEAKCEREGREFKYHM